MKLQGIAGQGSGKLGSQVWASSGGQQIVRQYKATIANPNTPAQVEQRAKFKLMSQVAASMASVIVMPKKGLVSSRNKFVKKNFDLVYMAGEEVGMSVENIQLTGGNAGFPAVNASRVGAINPISVTLASSAASIADRVVYNAFAISSEGNLQLVGSVVATDPGVDGDFPATLPANQTDTIIYAYGMKDTNAKATAKYGNYSISSGVDIANLFMDRKLSMSDFQLTSTSGNILPAGDTSTPDVPVNYVKITAYAPSFAYVQEVGGAQPSRYLVVTKQIGTSVSIQAADVRPLHEFTGWRDAVSGNIVSTERTYTFNATQDVTLYAIYS